MPDPRTTVSEALAMRTSEVVGLPVERNAPEPPDLDAETVRIIQIDGPEVDAPAFDDQTGLLVSTMELGFEVYLSGASPADAMNALLGRMRAGWLTEPTLGGILYGNWHEEFSIPFFDGLLLGALSRWEPFRNTDAGPGGLFVQELVLKYAMDPSTGALVRPGDER